MCTRKNRDLCTPTPESSNDFVRRLLAVYQQRIESVNDSCLPMWIGHLSILELVEEHRILPDIRPGLVQGVVLAVVSHTLAAVLRIVAEEVRHNLAVVVHHIGEALRRIVVEEELHSLADPEVDERRSSHPECRSSNRCYRARA